MTTTSPPKNASQPEQSAENLAVVVNNLEIPWEVAFLPAGQMLLIERPGNLYLRESGNKGE
ncbi:MAG TPA: PQQ-dependent sugar dehydrogenase [bacterium]|nr:PQQ-dependent sugar dehydrogenase [bacterium]HNS33764.1 PQQ-dependent sugar dehydrogenase [bacterium]